MSDVKSRGNSVAITTRRVPEYRTPVPALSSAYVTGIREYRPDCNVLISFSVLVDTEGNLGGFLGVNYCASGEIPTIRQRILLLPMESGHITRCNKYSHAD